MGKRDNKKEIRVLKRYRSKEENDGATKKVDL